jgi:hypothetical protein
MLVEILATRGRGQGLMPICAGIKRSGGRCTVSVEPGQTYCHHHDPGRASQRSRAASKAGKSKPSRELREIKNKLSTLADDVLAGSVASRDAGVVSQIYNVHLRAVSIEMKVREVEELEQSVTELRARLEEIGRGRWGA